MRKLVIGIAVVALLALLVVPAMAFDPPVTATAYVTITVEPYGAISFPGDDDTLDFDVDGLNGCAGSGCSYMGRLNFNVKCNLSTTLTVMPDCTTMALYDPGAGFWYPTANGKTGTATNGHQIGYGLSVYNATTNTTGAWTESGTEGVGKVSVPFNASQTTDEDPSGYIQCNSYIDSAKGTDALAPEGVYEATLTLTLTPP